jgi:hypothetical protein
MAEINSSVENVRATLTEALGRLRKANAEYFEMLGKGLGSSQLPIANQAKEFCDFMQRNVSATFDLSDKLTMRRTCRTPSSFSPTSSRTRCAR